VLLAWELRQKCATGEFGIPRNGGFCYELSRLLPPQPGLNISACRYPHRPGPAAEEFNAEPSWFPAVDGVLSIR